MTTLETTARTQSPAPREVLVGTETLVAREVVVDICCALALAESTLAAAGLTTEADQIGDAFELAESVLFT